MVEPTTTYCYLMSSVYYGYLLPAAADIYPHVTTTTTNEPMLATMNTGQCSPDTATDYDGAAMVLASSTIARKMLRPRMITTSTANHDIEQNCFA